jgi:hypothetical protein
VSIPISRTVISLLSASRATSVSPSITRDTAAGVDVCAQA